MKKLFKNKMYVCSLVPYFERFLSRGFYPGGLNVSGNNRFYSTSLPSLLPDKLFINSTPDGIVFMQYDDNIQRSVLILPSLKSFLDLSRFQVLVAKESLLNKKELKMKLELEMKDLHIALSKIM